MTIRGKFKGLLMVFVTFVGTMLAAIIFIVAVIIVYWFSTLFN